MGAIAVDIEIAEELHRRRLLEGLLELLQRLAAIEVPGELVYRPARRVGRDVGHDLLAHSNSNFGGSERSVSAHVGQRRRRRFARFPSDLRAIARASALAVRCAGCAVRFAGFAAFFMRCFLSPGFFFTGFFEAFRTLAARACSAAATTGCAPRALDHRPGWTEERILLRDRDVTPLQSGILG